jgi:hypothetical protein
MARTHTHTHTHTHTQLVGFRRTRDRPVSETFTLQDTTLTRDKSDTLPSGYEPAIPESERP